MTTKTRQITKQIFAKAETVGRPLKFMELCGTHSRSIARHGIKQILPSNITLVTGPGCPVCVTDQEDIDIIVGLAANKIPVAVYGDTVNVPGTVSSLEKERRRGADVNIVYDTTQALVLAKVKPGLVFFGLGFETTAPMTAWAIKNGLIAYSAHKLFPPAMAALLAHKAIKIDGFINPGHVSAIIGTKVYEQFKVPQVIAGFSGLDVLKAIDMLLSQIIARNPKVENEYGRVVKPEGNGAARDLIAEVFRITDARWRGLGVIAASGLKIKKKYREQDAEFVHHDLIGKIKSKIKIKPSACRCGEILQGLIEPRACPLFGKACTPDTPYGACMVSVEGACHIEMTAKLLFDIMPKSNFKRPLKSTGI